MNVTRDVIADLLPLYEAGEGSVDTRRLVEEYLKEHPDTLAAASVDTRLRAEPASRPEKERRASLERTRSLIKTRSIFFGAALASNLMPFSFAFSGDAVTWFMWRDAPGTAAVLMGISIGCWIAYFRALNQLRVSGM